MRVSLISIVVFLAIALTIPVSAQGTTPVITSPSNGQVLQGQVAITGATDVLGFASAEVAFAYTSDTTNTWFTIWSGTQSVFNGVIATWDPTAISDGDYVLRLRVNLQDGTTQDVTVAVQVRNYTAQATPTPTTTPTSRPALQIPTPILVAATPTSAAPPTIPIPTPTPLPANPAEVTQNQIYANFQRGALIIAGIFVFFGILLRLRRS